MLPRPRNATARSATRCSALKIRGLADQIDAGGRASRGGETFERRGNTEMCYEKEPCDKGHAQLWACALT